MFEEISHFVSKVLAQLLSPLESLDSFLYAISGIGRAVIEVGSVTAWPYLLSSIVVAWLVFVLMKRKKAIDGALSFRKFLFPAEMYLHPSAIVDYKFVAIDWSVKFVLYVPLMAGVSGLLYEGSVSLFGRWSLTLGTMNVWSSALLSTITAILIIDFGWFFAHYLTHKIPLLWIFHQVHHSAEVLTPVTVYRNHPMDDFIKAFTGTALSGIGPAAYTSMTGQSVNVISLFGLNVFAFFFFICAYQLRHSHVWLSYGALGYLFLSPAQHQIHHSVDPKHVDKNFGLLFSIWDGLFGSLYVPKEEEKLVFGLPFSDPRDFSTVPKLYFLPFLKVFQMLTVKTAFSNQSIPLPDK